MKLYNVEIVETSSLVVDQEANSYEGALNIVKSKYDNEDIVLDWEDLEDVNFKPYPSQNLKENFKVTILFDNNKKQLYVEDKKGSNSYNCKNVEDLKSLLNEYFDNNIELEPVKPEQNINKKDKDRER